jgi:hypothetical protein
MLLTHHTFSQELTIRVDTSHYPRLTKSLWIGASLTPISAFLCWLSPPTHANPGDLNLHHPSSAFHPSQFTFHFSLFTSQIFLPYASHILLFILTFHLPPHQPSTHLSVSHLGLCLSSIIHHLSIYHPYSITHAFPEEGCRGSRHTQG